MTEQKAKDLLQRWVSILRLHEWNIDFRWCVRAEAMNVPESVGCTSFNSVGRQAVIQMLDPVDFHNDYFPYDYEKTLVHELLHLKFADLDNSGNELQDHLLHCMVDDLAKAFIRAKEGTD